MLNGLFVLCCFCRNALRVHTFLQLHEYSGYLIHVIPQRALMKKGFTHSPISSRIKCRNSPHFPEKSGSHQFTSFAGFSNPHPRQNKKQLANKTLTRPYMRMSSDSKPPHFLTNSSVQTTSGNFSGFSKNIPVSKQQNTKQWHSHTKKAHKNPNKTKQTKKQIQTKQISKQNKTLTPSKQNSKHKKTTKTQKRSKATRFQTQKKTSNKTTRYHKPFSLWVHISEVSGSLPALVVVHHQSPLPVVQFSLLAIHPSVDDTWNSLSKDQGLGNENGKKTRWA